MDEAVARDIIEALYAATPVPPGCRVNHARGILAEGRFRPSTAAGRISNAEVFAGRDQPMLVRFSSSSGDPGIGQDDPRADPRGVAIRVGDPAALVLVGHSVEAFPAADGAAFLGFLKAASTSADHPDYMEDYLTKHEAARRFTAVRPGPPPRSFAEETYHMLHPYRLAYGGKEVIGRLSVAGSGAERPRPTGVTGPDYLDSELRSRIEGGVVELSLIFHAAPSGIDVADVSGAWPVADGAVELGKVLLDRIPENQSAQARLSSDPGTLPHGVAFAGDRLIKTRLAAYRLAFERRLGD